MNGIHKARVMGRYFRRMLYIADFKKTLVGLLTAWTLILIVAIILDTCTNIPVRYVHASGNTETTLYLGSNGIKSMNWYDATDESWNYYRTAAEADSAAGGLWAGWEYSTTGDNHVFPYSSIITFDISSIPEDVEILEAHIVMKASALYDTYNSYDDFFFGLFKTDPGLDYAITKDDNFNWYDWYNLGYFWQTAPYHYNDLVEDEEFEMELLYPEEALETYKTTDNISFHLASVNHMLNYAPNTGGESDGNRIRADFENGIGSPNYPKLVITYVGAPDARTPILHENAPTDNETTGYETADNITLETLRCMYADETMSFLVNGDSGANISLEMRNTGGELIDSSSDSVRTDGIFSWQLDLANDFSGIVRVHELNNDLWSQWVCVRPSPDSSQSTNKVYSYSTEYPQYTEPFSSYVVDDGDLMFVHWKTNLDGSSELPDYDLELYSNGNSDNPVYSENLSTVAEYLGGTVANQEALTHWRYAIFTPSIEQGQNDYGGLVQDLDFDEARTLRRGFVQPIIVSDNGTEFATTHSAYWYLSSADEGIILKVEKSQYGNEETPVVSLDVGGECKVERNLCDGTARVMGESTNTFQAFLGHQRLVLPVVETAGDYTIRITLSQAGIHTYEYIYDMGFEVIGEPIATGTKIPDTSTPGGIWERLKELLFGWGLDTDGGHYMVIFFGMIALAVIFWKQKLLAVGMPLLLLGLGIVIGWVDQWLVILLALGAGVFIWSIFRKKASGGEA